MAHNSMSYGRNTILKGLKEKKRNLVINSDNKRLFSNRICSKL
jgi:hypothetical protein